MGSLKRIAEALEQQAQQIHRLHDIYERTCINSEESVRISLLHLAIAEESHQLHMIFHEARMRELKEGESNAKSS